MYRFKVSKYKNTTPKLPKKEQCINEIPCGKIFSSCGDFVKCSGKHLAFSVDSGGGGCVGVLPLEATGRRNWNVPLIYAHAEFVTDMDFSPFGDNLLATCSHDGMINLWDIEDFGDSETLNNPIQVFHPEQESRKIDIVKFHPSADGVFSCAVGDSVCIFDLHYGSLKYAVKGGTGAFPQSLGWKFDGSTLITSSKDTKYRTMDPRAEGVVNEFSGFAGNKDSRLVWLGTTDYILGTGFNKQRERCIGIWDIRNTSQRTFTLTLDQASGTLMPFHDIDTNMVMVAGKGDSYVSLYEFNEDTKELTMSSSQNTGYQTYGMGMAPKRVMNVMEGEANRLYQLSKNTITPLPYVIPRKSYRDFHSDLFPDTVYSGIAVMDAHEWFEGNNKMCEKLSLDPKSKSAKVKTAGLKVENTEETKKKVETKVEVTSDRNPQTNLTQNVSAPNTIENEERDLNESPTKSQRDAVNIETQQEPSDPVRPSNSKAKFKTGHVSKFKYMVGQSLHKDNNIENVKNLAESLAMESDAFKVLRDFVVVPFGGPSGKLGVFQLSNPCRLPEFDVPVLVNGAGVLDFDIDPFDNNSLAVACDDWKIRIWRIPDGGLSETMEEPLRILHGHDQRVTMVRYHPTASNILASASTDNTIRVWQLDENEEIGALEGHTDQILCMSWHPDGEYLATLCKDNKIRVYQPVEDVEPIKEGDGPAGLKGARISWCGTRNNWLVVSTVGGKDGRSLCLYDSEDFKQLGKIESIDTSPSVLSIFYDEDTSTLFATGKGDRTIYTFEIHEEEPHLFPLSPFQHSTQHQGVGFLQKNTLDVRKVEFAKAARLTKTNIELVSFTMPRVKTEYFQDDIFGETRVTWEAALTGESWLDGEVVAQKWISLKPQDMKNLSEAPKETAKAAKYCSQDILSEKTDEEKKAELVNAMIGKLDVDTKLEQDDFEGVEDDEWED